MTTALITGASSGIGRALAKLMAAEGYDLILVARPGKELESALAETQEVAKGSVIAAPQDLSRPGAGAALMAQVGHRPIDILVNNAGTGEFGRFQEVEWARYERTLHLNIVALTELTHAVLPQMRNRNSGQIVNISSTAAFQPLPWMAVYGATKAYVQSLTEALAFELRKTRIKITAFCPGATNSGFASAAQAQSSNNFREGKTATPAQIAAEILKEIHRERSAVVVHGLINRVKAFLAPMSPRAIVLRMADGAMKPVGS